MPILADATSVPGGAFAQLSDVEALALQALSTEQQARAEKLLLQAANKIRSYTRQNFDHVTTTDKVRAIGNLVRLPQRPVVAITGVKLIDYLGNEWPVPAYGFDGIDRLDLALYGTILNLPEAVSLEGYWSGTVEVTYEHGYETVPQEIIDLNAELVARIFNSPTQGAVGVRAQGVGPYNVSFDPATSGGMITLTAEDRATLDRYRVFGQTVELR